MKQRQAPGIAELAWPEGERRLAGGALALLPVGAACKEHGLHLPMNTGWIQAEWLAGELIRRHNVLVWPIVAYGFYPAFRFANTREAAACRAKRLQPVSGKFSMTYSGSGPTPRLS